MKKTKKNNLRKYECLFILDTVGKEEAEKEILDRVQKEIQAVGGKVETVQKMGAKPFARNAQGRTTGSYVNMILNLPPKAIRELDTKFHLDTDLFRWHFTEWVEPPVRKPRKLPPGEQPALSERPERSERFERGGRDRR